MHAQPLQALLKRHQVDCLRHAHARRAQAPRCELSCCAARERRSRAVCSHALVPSLVQYILLGGISGGISALLRAVGPGAQRQQSTARSGRRAAASAAQQRNLHAYSPLGPVCTPLGPPSVGGAGDLAAPTRPPTVPPPSPVPIWAAFETKARLHASQKHRRIAFMRRSQRRGGLVFTCDGQRLRCATAAGRTALCAPASPASPRRTGPPARSRRAQTACPAAPPRRPGCGA